MQELISAISPSFRTIPVYPGSLPVNHHLRRLGKRWSTFSKNLEKFHPCAAVLSESVVAFEIARAFREKFGGDSLQEVKRDYEEYLEQIKN